MAEQIAQAHGFNDVATMVLNSVRVLRAENAEMGIKAMVERLRPTLPEVNAKQVRDAIAALKEAEEAEVQAMQPAEDDGDMPMDDGEPKCDERMGPILAAAEQGDAATMGALLDSHGLGVDTPGEDGDTVLHIGCLYGQKAVVQEALRRGASATACDEEGSTPLHDASAGGYYEIATMLLAAGAQIHVRDGDGDTPLHLAANGGHGNVAELLLERAGAQSAREMLASANGAGARPADLADDPTLVTKLRIAMGEDEDGMEDADGGGGARAKKTRA